MFFYHSQGEKKRDDLDKAFQVLDQDFKQL